MTKEQQKLAIMEWLGWQERGGGPEGIYYTHPITDGEFLFSHLANWPEDLNDMHEAEKKLSDEQRRDYIGHLNNIAGSGGMIDDQSCDSAFNLATATAPQRSEALLRTIGKWVE